MALMAMVSWHNVLRLPNGSVREKEMADRREKVDGGCKTRRGDRMKRHDLLLLAGGLAASLAPADAALASEH
jgi:hypothetical protein